MKVTRLFFKNCFLSQDKSLCLYNSGLEVAKNLFTPDLKVQLESLEFASQNELRRAIAESCLAILHNLGEGFMRDPCFLKFEWLINGGNILPMVQHNWAVIR